MNVYLLEARDWSPMFEPWYDKAFGFVVAAESQSEARLIASKRAGDEGADAWLTDIHTSIKELGPGVKAGILLRSFAGA